MCICRVSALQSRVSQQRTQLFSEVIQKLLSKSYVEEGITVTRRKEVVTEIRMIDTNPAFKHVQECLNWIEAKQVTYHWLLCPLQARNGWSICHSILILCPIHIFYVNG